MFTRAAANARQLALLTLAMVILATAAAIFLWQSRGESAPTGPPTTLECAACRQRFALTPLEFERALAAAPQSGPAAAMAKLRCKLCGAREAAPLSAAPTTSQQGGTP